MWSSGVAKAARTASAAPAILRAMSRARRPALGLAVAAAMDELRHLAPGTGGDARVGLAQRDAVPAREAPEDLDAAVQELAVGRVGDGLGLDGGVDGDAL